MPPGVDARLPALAARARSASAGRWGRAPKVLENMLLREQEEGQITPEAAFLSCGVRLFGFDPDDDYMTDGPKDYGFDYLHITNENCTIFQSKSLSYANGIDSKVQISPSYLDDLRQIIEVLKHVDTPPKDCNKQLNKALISLRNEISQRALQRVAKQDETEPPSCSITLILLALRGQFTKQAQTEFGMLNETVFEYASVKVSVSVSPVFIPEMLDELWTQRNNDWKDRKGSKQDKIMLNVEGDVIRDA